MATSTIIMIFGAVGLAASSAACVYGYKKKEDATINLGQVSAVISIVMILLGGM